MRRIIKVLRKSWLCIITSSRFFFFVLSRIHRTKFIDVSSEKKSSWWVLTGDISLHRFSLNLNMCCHKFSIISLFAFNEENVCRESVYARSSGDDTHRFSSLCVLVCFSVFWVNPWHDVRCFSRDPLLSRFNIKLRCSLHATLNWFIN